MKCNAKPRLTGEVQAAALSVVHDMMVEQSDKVTARCYNEFAVAMLQANLSPRTIGRVQDILRFAVLPKLDEYYKTDSKAKDNIQSIADADTFVEMYLQEHGVTPMTPEKKGK